jgi:hypothetical protein
VRKKVRGERV